MSRRSRSPELALALVPPRVLSHSDQNGRTVAFGRGLGIHWPELDEDLHVAHLLGISD